MNVLVLLLAYRYNVNFFKQADKPFAIRMAKICKLIRDEAKDPTDKLICRNFIKLVSIGEYKKAIDALRKAEISFYIKEMGGTYELASV